MIKIEEMMKEELIKIDNKNDESERDLYVVLNEEPQPSKKTLHVYITGGIPSQSESIEYQELIHRIYELTENDEIYLHINSHGGSVYTTAQLINVLKATPATITAILEGIAFSAATFIFLVADRYIVHDHSVMMFHTFSMYGLYGKETELTPMLDGLKKLFTRMAKSTWIPFLSEEETQRILNGYDLWLDSKEIKKRLKRAVKIQSKQVNKDKEKTEGKAEETTDKKDNIDE